jgi:hypothetical protein
MISFVFTKAIRGAGAAPEAQLAGQGMWLPRPTRPMGYLDPGIQYPPMPCQLGKCPRRGWIRSLHQTFCSGVISKNPLSSSPHLFFYFFVVLGFEL